MRHKIVSISEDSLNFITYSDFNSSETNDSERSRMKKILQKAILDELTDKQRYCLCEYFLNGRNMKSIADDLNVNPSTVTRHIQSAMRRLKRVTKYY